MSVGSSFSACAISRNSTTSSRRSPRSNFETNDCGRPSRRASPTCVKPAARLASARMLRRCRYFRPNAERVTPSSLKSQDGISQNRLLCRERGPQGKVSRSTGPRSWRPAVSAFVSNCQKNQLATRGAPRCGNRALGVCSRSVIAISRRPGALARTRKWKMERDSGGRAI